MHLFLLGHEVGHYINGDLNDQSHFVRCNWAPDASVFSANISHEMEFKADKVAFEVVLKSLAALQPDFPARRALDLSVTLFFNFVREISNSGSETHPRSSDRLLAVTHEFFGNDAASLMKKSFNDLSFIKAFQAQVGNQTVADILKTRT